MITSFNPADKIQFEMYSNLFAKAYADLAKAGKLTEIEIANGRFTSLDEYFAHMSDLYNININYIMLPLDEGTEGLFKIDANTRTITIPAQFNKCAAVVSDEMCEIAVFTIDRYYDFQDLDRVSICVQWTNALGEEGISHIQLKDLETYPGKLRFGWPLTSKITKAAGPVHFAVRFYKGIEDEDGKIKYQYLLNTLTNTITIKSSLTIENPKIEEENVSGLFASFIANSMNPSYPQPVSPFFVAPGQDLIAEGQTEPGYGVIGADNTLKMSAQAVVKDLGVINYKWMYIPSGSNTPVDVSTLEGYEINNKDAIKLDPKPTERNGNQQYYTKREEDGRPVYEIYTGEFPVADNIDLYILKTSLTIVDGEQEIVGSYYVEATNTVSVNTSTPVASSKCVVPAPSKIEFVENKNLPAHVFTDKTAKNVTLNPVIAADSNLPQYSYQWYYTTVTPVGLSDIIKEGNELEDGKESSYVVNQPGWYALHINALLNRKEEEADSGICKVTHHPKAPAVTKLAYAKIETTDEIDSLITNFEDSKWEELAADSIDADWGKYVVLRVDTDLDTLNPLDTEELSYKWMVQEPDKDIRPLGDIDTRFDGTILNTDTTGFDKKFLVVRIKEDTMNYSYHCEITNKIQTESAMTDTSTINTFTIV